MKLVSGRRTRSRAAGQNVEDGLQRHTISEQGHPTSSVRSARCSERRQHSSCLGPTPTPCPSTWPKSPASLPRTRTPSSTWIKRASTISNHLVVPDNITILPLPPKSPELNPGENLWLFLRENWLSNQVLKSYEDTVDYCCDAWRRLESQPWRIMSNGRREWANGF